MQLDIIRCAEDRMQKKGKDSKNKDANYFYAMKFFTKLNMALALEDSKSSIT